MQAYVEFSYKILYYEEYKNGKKDKTLWIIHMGAHTEKKREKIAFSWGRTAQYCESKSEMWLWIF